MEKYVVTVSRGVLYRDVYLYVLHFLVGLQCTKPGMYQLSAGSAHGQ